MKRTALLVVALAAVILVVPSAAAWACSCASLTPRAAVTHADVVVRGVVGPPATPDKDPVGSADPVSYPVTVGETFKGDAVPRLDVTSARDGASCGIEVVPGREYVLFAAERGGHLEATLCGGTAPATSAASLAGGAALVAVVAAAVVVWVRRRHLGWVSARRWAPAPGRARGRRLTDGWRPGSSP